MVLAITLFRNLNREPEFDHKQKVGDVPLSIFKKSTQLAQPWPLPLKQTIVEFHGT